MEADGESKDAGDTTVFRGKMAPKLKRTCLSAKSALSGKPNVEEVPLGAKLPMIPGSRLQLYTSRLGEKLLQPSCDFDRTYPSDVYISNEYRCLHDPHLRHYFLNRPDMTKRLRKRSFITNENKVVCSLNEYNLYRQYLKHLSIEYFNKIYREKYEKELQQKREANKNVIEQKKKDPNNPITKRIEWAKTARCEMERIRYIKRRKILRAAQRERDVRANRKREEMQQRIKEELRRESTREKLKKVKLIRDEEERQLKDELRFYKHQEDFYRSRELEELKKMQIKEREMKLTEKYERKKRFHLMKMAELSKLMQEEQEEREKSVQSWKDHFANQLARQQEKFRKFLEKERRAREESKRRIEESLRARGWNEQGRVYQQPNKTGHLEPKKVFKKKKDTSRPMTPHQLSALGFHSAVVPRNMIDLLWDRTSNFSCTSSEEAEEHAAGDALAPAGPSISEQARTICDDALVQGHARYMVDGVLTSSTNIHNASSQIVEQAIGLCKDVLLPMLQTYEQKTGSRIPDVNVPSTIRDLFDGVLDIDEDDIAPLVSLEDSGKASIKPGKRESSVRFELSSTHIPQDGAHGQQRRRPTTPKHRVRFGSPDASTDELDLDISESQVVLEQTIKVLASKVVNQVFQSSHSATLDKVVDMEERVAHLAGSVVNEIIAFETTSDQSVEKRSTSPSLSESSGSSGSSSTFSETSLNRKISWLAKEMIKDVVYDEAPETSVTTQSDTDGSVLQRASTASDLSILALRVVRSALNAVHSNVDFKNVDEGGVYQQIEPLIHDLSCKLVEQVMKERQQSTDLTEKDHYAELENKISKLALNIVSSVLQGTATSASSSMTSLSSVAMEARVNEMTLGIVNAILDLKRFLPSSYKPTSDTNLQKNVKDMTVEDFIQEIFNLKALGNAPRKAFRNLNDVEIQRISQNLARKIVPARDTSSALSSGINDLAAAITESAIKKYDPDASLCSTESFVTDSIENAMKNIAEAMVKDALCKTSKISTNTRSALSSGVEELAAETALTALNRAENLSQESAVDSGTSELAGDIVENAMIKAGDLGSSTNSAISSGASLFALEALKESIFNALQVGSSTQSALSSGLKNLTNDLTENTLENALANASTLDNSSQSALSSGISQLAEEIAKLAVSDGNRLVRGEMESVVSSAVSQMVVDTLASRVLERIMEISPSRLDVEHSKRLQLEITKIVRSLIDARASASNTNSASLTLSSDTMAGQSDLEKLLTATDQSTMSSAASLLAGDIVRALMGKMSKPAEEPAGTQTTVGAVTSDTTESKLSKSESTTNNTAKSKQRKKGVAKSTITVNKKQTSLPAATKCKSFAASGTSKKVYKSSFSNWRLQEDLIEATMSNQLTMEAPETRSGLHQKSEKFDSIELTPIAEEDQEEDGGRKSEMQVLLDGLASRIVESALGAASGGGVKTDLNDSKSVEKLVESLALGVVTSLLGLDSHQTSSSPSQLDSTVGSITDDTETDDSKESVTLLPSAGKISPKIKPKKTRPGSGEPIQKQISNSSISRKIREEDARKCEELTKMLQSTKTDFNADKRYMSPCEDNAQSHPHRVISSENGAWTAKSSRPRKTLRSPYQFSPYEKSPYPPRSKSGSRQRKGRRRADCAFLSEKKI